MCGRYTLSNPEDIPARFAVDVEELLRRSYNIAPSQDEPVIMDTADGRRLETMRWGLVPAWAEDTKIGFKLINARSETVFDKPTWKKLITSQRCLIPASGFYEWKKADSGKQPYFIHPADQPLFAFAGIWTSWQTPSGESLQSYSILTTRSNAEMETIHDRMPVILHSSDEADWLNPDMTEVADIEQYLRPLEDGALEMYPVNKDVNSVRVNEERLVGPVNSE